MKNKRDENKTQNKKKNGKKIEVKREQTKKSNVLNGNWFKTTVNQQIIAVVEKKKIVSI